MTDSEMTDNDWIGETVLYKGNGTIIIDIDSERRWVRCQSEGWQDPSTEPLLSGYVRKYYGCRFGWIDDVLGWYPAECFEPEGCP